MLACTLSAQWAWGQSAVETLIEPCPRTNTFPIPNNRGPWDFRTNPGVRMVESNHFTPNVENLEHGNTGTLAAEIAFLLHAFPNHPRGLATLMRWSIRDKTPQPGNLDYTVECYFLRAERFRPDDLIVRMLHADYMIQLGRPKDASMQLDYVAIKAGDNPFTHYNLGLLYFQMGRYKDAREQAWAAMDEGMERKDLIERLRAKGEWSDPPASAASAPVDAASGASAATH
ncbi:MAG: ABC transporter permease [Burkholderiales bacterium]|nr:ABC transporter permease [Burkholderiales bacterium]